MNYFYRWLGDVIVDSVECFVRLNRLVSRKKHQPSLLVYNVIWFTNSEWMDRLVAYKQLDLWTAKQ